MGLLGGILRRSDLRAAEADLTLARALCSLLQCGECAHYCNVASGIRLWWGLQFPARSGALENALVTKRAKSMSLKANIYFTPSLYSKYEPQSSKFKVEKSNEIK